MRLIYWSPSYWPQIGGIEVMGMRLLPALRARGYEPIVVTSHAHLDLPDEGEYGGIPIHRFQFLRALQSRDPGLLSRTQKLVTNLKRSFRPDIEHVNFGDGTPFFHLHSTPACPCPTVLTIQVGVPEQSGPDTLFSRLVRSADWVTAVSRRILDDLRTAIPVSTHTSSVIYNGIDPAPMEPAPLPLDEPRLLCLGRVIPEKGFDLAVRALSLLAERFPRLRMTIAGDGPAVSDLRTLAQALGVSDRTDFAGWVDPDRVPALIDKATIVLMPSRWVEAFGIVALQAAQRGRPVVATRRGGLPEVVADGESGFIVEPEDATSLAAAIATLLAEPGRAARMGATARRRAEELFNWEHLVDSYDSLFRRIAGATAQRASA